MKTFSASLQFGVRLLIFLNLLTACACIWAFLRIAPSPEEINRHNNRSLEACENMLILLAEERREPPEKLIAEFEKILQRAENNITEKGERETLEHVKRSFTPAFRGDQAAFDQTVRALYTLAKLNREAMGTAARNVKTMGLAGAWGVVFMAVLIFLCGILLLARLRKGIFQPLDEIRETLHAHKNGDLFRRCHLPADAASDIRETGHDLNSLLDTATGNMDMENHR